MFTAEFHAASDYLLASDHIYWCYFLTNKKKKSLIWGGLGFIKLFVCKAN